VADGVGERVHLAAKGVPAERVRVTGIPVDPAFAEPMDRDELRRGHGLETDRPVVLVLCGGFGVGPVTQVVDRLAGALAEAQLVVITGKNEELKARLEEESSGWPGSVRVLGFTRVMHEWMALSDLAVAKPGGLTTAETRNATMLYEEGAAISGENPWTIGERVARLLADAGKLASMRENARRLGRPGAAHEVALELGEMARSDGP